MIYASGSADFNIKRHINFAIYSPRKNDGDYCRICWKNRMINGGKPTWRINPVAFGILLMRYENKWIIFNNDYSALCTFKVSS